jgi:hypothetical protein
MMRGCPSILALCTLLYLPGEAAAQSVARKDCPPGDPSCSVTVPGFAAIGLRLFAPRPDGEPSEGQRPGIVVAPLTLAEPASWARLQIEVGPQEALPKASFVRIRGLPPAASVPQGHAITAGAWAVPLVALPDLVIGLPEGLSGSSDVAITLVTADGGVLAEARTRLLVASHTQAGQPQDATAMRITPEDRERALQLHARGLEQLELGNIVAARRFFELAMEAGLPQSVMALAGTYDPVELASLGAFGPRPDVEVARTWYRRAHAMGAAGAELRLQRLGSR